MRRLGDIISLAIPEMTMRPHPLTSTAFFALLAVLPVAGCSASPDGSGEVSEGLDTQDLTHASAPATAPSDPVPQKICHDIVDCVAGTHFDSDPAVCKCVDNPPPQHPSPSSVLTRGFDCNAATDCAPITCFCNDGQAPFTEERTCDEGVCRPVDERCAGACAPR